MRKKWTHQTEVTDALLKLREKKKWQLNYRRYVLEGARSESYAPYFGLDMATLREWFELQFTDGLHWENFGKAWQFDHIIPTNYFDYSNEEDLKLCWNFINMRVDSLLEEKNPVQRVDLIAVRPYFENLYQKTGYALCLKMLAKIESIERANNGFSPAIEDFLLRNKTLLENIATLDASEFNSLNQGSTVDDILLEREILRKFGTGPKP